MIHIKTSEEINIMKEGGQILAKILQDLAEASKPGVTTADLDKLARELLNKHNADSAFLGHEGYPAVLCASINNGIVHGLPSSRKLIGGDLLKLDMGVLLKRFYTDSAITVIVPGGEPDPIKQKLLNVTKESLRIGISKVRIGNTIGDIGHAIQQYVEGEGFGVVRGLVGHGIGRNLWEAPQIPNYGKAGMGLKIVEGMVIAIEPMVVTGKTDFTEDKDGYTFNTTDGGLAAHFEHTVAIQKTGPIILTQ